MQNSKQRKGKYVLFKWHSLITVLQGRMYILFILNILTTTLQIVWGFFVLGILFVFLVSLFSGTTEQFFPFLGSLFRPGDPLRAFLLITTIVFLVLPIFVWTIRRLARDWPAQDDKKYLLTWEKVRERRSVIIRGMWSAVQVIWAGLILAVIIPLTTDLLEKPLQEVINSTLIQFIRPVFLGPNLQQHVALSAIVTFIFLSLILRLLAHSQSKEETIVSVKELDAVSKELREVQRQQLEHLSERVLEYADKQFIKEQLIDKVNVVMQEVEEQIQQLRQKIEDEKKVIQHQYQNLEQALTQEKADRQEAEKQMQRLKQQIEDEKKVIQHIEEELQDLKQQTDNRPS